MMMNISYEASVVLSQLIHHKPWDALEQTHRLHTLHSLKTVPNIFERTCNTPGHITASAWVVNRNYSRILLQKHKIRDIWLSSGGHADGPNMPSQVAIKELFEEVGKISVKLLEYEAGGPENGNIFDIDTHQVPPNLNKKEPDHLHFDFRYLLMADDNEPLPRSPENIETRWFTLAEAEEYFPIGGGRRRCLEKIRELSGMYR